MKTKIKSLFLLHLIALFVFPQVLTATIINVPDDQSSIQAGINAASNGDTILVQPGTYHEHINFYGKVITVGSMFITTGDEAYVSSTIINGSGSGSCAKFNSGESSASVLSGFTLTNGGNYYGAGVNCYSGSSPTLSWLDIINCNGDAGDSYGGGLCCMSGASPTCFNLTFIGNYANEGGAIYCHDNGNATFSECLFSDNTSAHGGAMQISYSDPSVNHSLFYANNSPFGGAVYVYNYSTPEFVNCTFSLNEADYGGAFYCSDLGGTPILTNCILWNDESSYNKEIFATSSTYPPIVTYSDVQDGTGQNWFGVGCIAEDPLFVDAATGDFHLLAGSPCIDGGDPGSPPDPDGSPADMGAFYFVGGSRPGMATTPVPADEATSVLLSQILMWTNGENTTNVDLYLDTINPPVNQFLFNEPAIEQFDPDLEYQTTYYWRVDCINEYAITVGTVWSFTTEINTSVSSLSITENVSMYPNPSTDYIIIEAGSRIEGLTVYNLTGSIIISTKPSANTFKLDISGFEKGIYLLLINTNGTRQVKGFSVN